MASAPSAAPGPGASRAAVRRWYEEGLGWPTAAGEPVTLLTGVRFDVLELPAEAGFAVLRRFPRTGPVALAGRRMRLLVAAGGAEELPGLLDWLEWGGVALDLTALGAGGTMAAPAPPGVPGETSARGPRGAGGSRCGPPAPVWLRSPEPGDAAPALPRADLADGSRGAVDRADGGPPGPGGREDVPGLVRLVTAAATACHRVRLARGSRQALAFS